MFVSARSLRSVLRLSAVLTVAWGVTGCSTVDGWVDSVTGSSTEAATLPPGTEDQGAATAGQSGGQTVAEASDQYPNIVDQPDKAPPSSSADEQKQVAEGLTADRSQAQYSGDALRGGTEAAAAPPAPAPPPPPPSTQTADTGGAPAAAAPSTDADSGTDSADATRDAGDLPTGKAPMPGALPAIQGGSTQVASARPTAPPPAAVTATPMPAPAAPPPSASPAMSPPPAEYAAPRASVTQPVSRSDASLGFQPSHAPPLDASVSQFVAPAVLDRYQQTAAMSSSAGIAGAPHVRAKAVRHRVKHKKPAAAAAATAAPADVPETSPNP